jgi:hypothetical protein
MMRVISRTSRCELLSSQSPPPQGKAVKEIHAILTETLGEHAPSYATVKNWALATQKKLAYLGFQCLDHPTYSPDLAPSDYHLFPGLKSN